MPVITYGGCDYEVQPGETVLEALLRQGAQVSHSCGKGSCHTCLLQRVEGQVAHVRAIDPGIEQDGHLLPCVATPVGDVVLGPPDLGRLSIAAELLSRRELAPGIHELAIAPSRELNFLPGQHVQIVRPDGTSRPYSIASLPGDDYFFTVHVREHDDGVMSRWLCREAAIGERLGVLPAQGDCVYSVDMADRPTLLLATGTGAGALLAIARQALGEGHRAPITLYHGVRDAADLYLHEALVALAATHPNFHYVPCVSQPTSALPEAARQGRVTQAFDEHADLAATELFLCGSPLMVEEARHRAALAGASRHRIHADPFESAHPCAPRDAAKIAALEPDPALWDALEQGPRLTRILYSFYDRVYEDHRLSPFFQGIAKEHVVSKQYAFLADVFSGKREYFGMNPFNSHHWMVISDDLFDYREALFESVLREDGLAEPLVRRWMALHELFRAEIVKSAARGIVSQGVEQPLRTHEVACLDIDAVCDRCGEEIPAGTPSRYLYRVGMLQCARCAGLHAHGAPALVD